VLAPQAALASPIGASLAHYTALAAPIRGMVKITSIKATQFRRTSLIKIETDAGIAGYGPFSGTGPQAFIQASTTDAKASFTS